MFGNYPPVVDNRLGYDLVVAYPPPEQLEGTSPDWCRNEVLFAKLIEAVLARDTKGGVPPQSSMPVHPR